MTHAPETGITNFLVSVFVPCASGMKISGSEN